ncbi:MAG: 30S ribosomal protein S4 [Elusimicrobiales bacterium]|nr:30S ribosomal protein S4 [Elusimicrobiales bacterium]
MARYTGASCKKCRKLETKLFLKGTKCYTACTMERRASKQLRPQHKGFRSKKSEYSFRLAEKQRARLMSGMTEQPFRNLFARAEKATGQTGEAFLRFLETRLDNVVRRLGFAVSLKTARQLVRHGHIKVNDRTVSIPSYQLKPGDKIAVISKLSGVPVVKQGIEETEKRSMRPSFLEYDASSKTGRLLRWPDRGEMSYPVKEQMIVEFYSK